MGFYIRIILLSFCLFTLSISSYAQKKEISQARAYIKSRTNLDKAESSMRALLTDSANIKNIKIYTTLVDIVRTQYEMMNEKMYLKQSVDTADMFITARRMFSVYEALDSIEMLNSQLKSRKKNSAYLACYRPNLYNGGIYFLNKNRFADAYDMFDTYIKCIHQPIFSGKQYKIDKLTNLAGYWATYSGFKLKSFEKVFRYSDMALNVPQYKERVMFYLSESYLLKKDTANYYNMLKKGFNSFKKSEYFFTRLVDYYNEANDYDSAMVVVNCALKEDANNKLFLFAKSNILLNLGQYDACIAVCDTLIGRQQASSEVYFNAGVSYINKALLLEKDIKNLKANNEKILALYKKALPYMENFRVLEPVQKKRWAPSLYNIYLKLNMGKQFEEMSNILNKLRT